MSFKVIRLTLIERDVIQLHLIRLLLLHQKSHLDLLNFIQLLRHLTYQILILHLFLLELVNRLLIYLRISRHFIPTFLIVRLITFVIIQLVAIRKVVSFHLSLAMSKRLLLCKWCHRELLLLRVRYKLVDRWECLLLLLRAFFLSSGFESSYA